MISHRRSAVVLFWLASVGLFLSAILFISGKLNSSEAVAVWSLIILLGACILNGSPSLQERIHASGLELLRLPMQIFRSGSTEALAGILRSPLERAVQPGPPESSLRYLRRAFERIVQFAAFVALGLALYTALALTPDFYKSYSLSRWLRTHSGYCLRYPAPRYISQALLLASRGQEGKPAKALHLPFTLEDVVGTATDIDSLITLANLREIGIEYLVVRSDDRRTISALDANPELRRTTNRSRLARDLIYRVMTAPADMAFAYGRSFGRQDEAGWRWATSEAEILLFNPLDRRMYLDLVGRAVSQGEPMELRARATGNYVKSRQISGRPRMFSLPGLGINPGLNVIRITASGAGTRGKGPGTKHRELAKFAIRDLTPLTLRVDPGLNPLSPLWMWLARLPDGGVVHYPVRETASRCRYDYTRLEAVHRKAVFNEELEPVMDNKLRQAMENIRERNLAFLLADRGVKYVILHQQLPGELMPPEDETFEPPGLELMRVDDEGTVYEVKPLPALFEAEAMHRWSGTVTNDPLASDGHAVVAHQQEDTADYVVYGPYVPLQAGRYRATFVASWLGQGRKESVAEIDVAIDRGARPVAKRMLTGEDFVEESCYNRFELEFELVEPRLVEFRVKYLGTGELRVDCIRLTK